MKHRMILIFLLGIMLSSCGGKTIRAVLVVDTSQDSRAMKEWDTKKTSSDFQGFLENSLGQKVQFTTVTTNGLFDAVNKNPTGVFSKLIQTNKEFGFFLTVHPDYSEDLSNVVYRALMATSLADTNKKRYFKQSLTNIDNVFEYGTNMFKNKHLEMSNIVFIWGRKVQKIRKIDLSDFMEYKPYEDLIQLRGAFILIEKVPGVLKSSKISLPLLLSNKMFYPNQNKISTGLYHYFEKNGLTNLLISNDTNTSVTHLCFGEYISTGREFAYMLLGPIEEGNFQDVVKKLESAGIQVYSDPIYTYNFE